MKKYILGIFSVLLFAFSSYGQVIPKPNPTAVGIGYKRLLADSTIFIPTGNGGPLLKSTNVNKRGAIYADSTNKRLWVFYPADSSWKLPIADTSNLVPYIGALKNTDLGAYGLKTNFTDYSITPVAVDAVGRLKWDVDAGTLTLGLKGGSVNLQVGQESVRLVHNNTGSTLTDGQVVYITGSTGELPSVGLASASSEATSSVTYGMVTESIAHGASGFITTEGIVHGLNTNAFLEGLPIWLSDTAGNYRQYPPAKPSHQVLVGYVVKKAGGNGSIDVKIQNGYELGELHDVSITSVADGDFLRYNSATSLWKNYTGSSLGYVKYTDTASMLAPYALESQIPSLAGYVPYTGATQNTVLGNYGLSAFNVTAEGGSGYAGQMLIKQGSSWSGGGAGYTSIKAFSNSLVINPTSLKQAYLYFGAISDGLPKTYMFPDATGTIALTSQTGSLTASNFILSGQTGSTGMYWTSDRVTIANYNPTGVVNIEANGGASVATFGGATYNNDFVGTGRFTGALSGTSATFSGIITGSRNDAGNVSATLANAYLNQGNLLNFQQNNGGSTINAYIGHGGDNTGNFIIVNNGLTPLTLAKSTGAATFSSSVTAAAFQPTYNTSYVTVDGTLSNYSATNAVYLNGNSGGWLSLSGDGSQSQRIDVTGGASGFITLRTSSTERMRITSSGNVGIGTSSPFSQGSGATTMELAGNTYGQFFVSANSASIRGVVMARASTLNDIYIASITNSPLLFGTNDTERMRITSGGNVLVGTTTDNGIGKLQVNGNIYSAYGVFASSLIGRSFAQTGSGGNTSYVDTYITNNSGNTAMYLVSYGGNPNNGGSGVYRANYVGYLSITTGYIGGALKQYIQYSPTAQFDATGVGALTCTPVFFNGSTETTTVNDGDASYYIRLKISGYNASYVGAYQYVYLTKLN